MLIAEYDDRMFAGLPGSLGFHPILRSVAGVGSAAAVMVLAGSIAGCGGPAWNLKIASARTKTLLPDELVNAETPAVAPEEVDPEPIETTQSTSVGGPDGTITETTRRVIGPDGVDDV